MKIWTLRAFIRALALWVLLLPVLAHADLSLSDPKVKELLRQKFRPTYTEVLEAFDGKLPSLSELQALLSAAQTTSNGTVVHQQGNQPFDAQALAKTIARLELVFPGGVWAPLGRDAVWIGDMLDIFYTNLGQEDRVSRLHASTSSFGARKYSVKDFVRSAGLRIEDFPHMRPFVLMDNTSFSPHSQSTKVIAAAYEMYKEKFKTQDIRPLLRYVGVASSAYGDRVTSAESAERFFADLEANSSEGLPSAVMQIQPMRKFMYSVAWHNTFGPFIKDSDGRIVGNPGSQFRNYHLSIVMSFVEAAETICTKQFLNMVRAEAKALGYNFDERLQLYRDPRVTAKYFGKHGLNLRHEIGKVLGARKTPWPKRGFTEIAYESIFEQAVDGVLEELNEKSLRNKSPAQVRAAIVPAIVAYERRLKQEMQQRFEAKAPISEPLRPLIYLLHSMGEAGKELTNDGLSLEAQEIRDFVEKHVEWGGSSSGRHVPSYLRLLDAAAGEKIITKSDYVLLVGHALAYVENSRLFYAEAAQLLDESRRLRAVLRENMASLLTNPKYEGVKNVVGTLIEKGLIRIPSDDCKYSFEHWQQNR